MKQIKLKLLLLLSISLVACNKNQDLELNPEIEETNNIETKTTDRESVFSSSSEFGGFTVSPMEDVALGRDDLRAILKSNGYYKTPTLSVTKEDMDTHKIPAHWIVFGQGDKKYGTINDDAHRLSALPSTKPTDNTLIIRNEDAKTKFNFYAKIDDKFKVKDKFAILAIDGDFSSYNNRLSFRGYSEFLPTPKDFFVLKKGEKQLGRRIPIMTDILPFDKVFNTKEPVKFKPRGVLLGLNLINNTGIPVKIKYVRLQSGNALYFNGSFNMSISDDGTNLLDMNSSGVTKGKPAQFESRDYPIRYNMQDDPFILETASSEPVALKNITKEMKEASPTLFVWGFPRPENKELIVSITYGFDQADRDLNVSHELRIPVPKGGFQEGYTYMLPVSIRNKRIDDSILQSTGITPLDYIPEFPFVNYGKTGFVQEFCIPAKNSNSKFLYPSDVGYFNWDEVSALFNDANKPAFLSNYVLPTKEQWNTIAQMNWGNNRYIIGFTDYHYNYRGQKNKQTITTKAQVGDEEAKNYTSDFIMKNEGTNSNPDYINYALAFKGTKWESAWRYSRKGDYHQQRNIIECIGGLQNSGLTLENISNKAFFENKAKTVRVFPAYGLYSDSQRKILSEWTSSAYLWSHKSSDNSPGYTFMGGDIETSLTNYFNEKGLPVCVFYKKLPKK